MDKFPEMTPKQRSRFIAYLLTNFDRDYRTITDCMEFFDVKVNEISFGMFRFTRTNQDNVLVKSSIPNPEDPKKLNLIDIFSLN
jgi:hypothetical protein